MFVFPIVNASDIFLDICIHFVSNERQKSTFKKISMPSGLVKNIWFFAIAQQINTAGVSISGLNTYNYTIKYKIFHIVDHSL